MVFLVGTGLHGLGLVGCHPLLEFFHSPFLSHVRFVRQKCRGECYIVVVLGGDDGLLAQFGRSSYVNMVERSVGPPNTVRVQRLPTQVDIKLSRGGQPAVLRRVGDGTGDDTIVGRVAAPA